MKNLKNIIYFTKEDGQNKLLFSVESGGYFEDVPLELIKKATKTLGHKPLNWYCFVDGTEFKIIPNVI
ncbi:hypothetical protein J2Z60_000131 [Lactobacillus colini]|uniref:Uncharacterized protein n=1 Tax=Lactobacillus colini TaxID=1819254 RepID=A0ABS4MBC9_9LACO|nr:hypothetical protein [Lactobacillus colini]MBP2056969.1 hypothetical protein [Lactobacillus colini]